MNSQTLCRMLYDERTTDLHIDRNHAHTCWFHFHPHSFTSSLTSIPINTWISHFRHCKTPTLLTQQSVQRKDSAQLLIDWVKVLRPTRHKIGHFGDVLPSQSLDVQHTQQQPFYGPLSRTTRVSWYQNKHLPTHHPDHHPIFISFLHLPRSIASSLFKLHAWQSFCTTSFHVVFGLPLGLEPSTSYSIHFFAQSVSSFCSTCPCHRNLFCCSINIISSIPSLSLDSLDVVQKKLNLTQQKQTTQEQNSLS